jgi:pyrrolysine biosynthesis protein PylD
VTRLQESDLSSLGRRLSTYDQELQEKTGLTLRQIACRAAGVDEEEIVRMIQTPTVGVIPVTVGEGTIPGFAQSVRDILTHLGFRAFVSRQADVAGFAEAVEEGADVVFMADDIRFVAINLPIRRVVNNGEATGRGYGAALGGLTGGVKGHPVLVIGAGHVGSAAAGILTEMGARIAVFDREIHRAERLAREVEGALEKDLKRALETNTMLVDASPASNIIDGKHITSSTVVAAPGVPLGLTDEARVRIGNRLIHDPLQIGVATMMIAAIAP